MNFAARMAPSTQFEERVIEQLRSIGWHAYPFGQALLSSECRQRLARFEDSFRRPCRVRWMGDIITFRDLPNGRAYVALIDAKVCKGQRYALEMSAVETAAIYTDHLYTPCFFVFDDWMVLTPFEARQRGVPGPFRGNGSGTPFLLVDKTYGQPFTDRFPPVLRRVDGDTR